MTVKVKKFDLESNYFSNKDTTKWILIIYLKRVKINAKKKK